MQVGGLSNAANGRERRWSRDDKVVGANLRDSCVELDAYRSGALCDTDFGVK